MTTSKQAADPDLHPESSTSLQNKTILENAISRISNISQKITEYAWSMGVSVFYLEGIPFSFFSGKWFADESVNIFNQVVSQIQEKSDYCLLEVGAGNGLFSKHFLDRLKKKNNDLYHHTTVVVSDYAESAINNLIAADLYKDHAEKVSFNVGDISNPEMLPKNTYDVITLIYVLDSLPTQHYRVKDGVLSEIKITTTLDKNFVAINTQSHPFSLLSYRDILAMYKNKDIKKLWFYSHQIKKFIEEDYDYVQVDDGKHSNLISEFVRTLDPDKTHYFNISHIGISALINIADRLPPGGCLLINEVGVHATEDSLPEELVSRYGCMMFYPVCFPFIIFVCEKFGLKLVSDPKRGALIFCKTGKNSLLNNPISTVDFISAYMSIQDVIKNTQAFKGRSARFESHVNAQLDRLSPLLRDDYHLNLNLGKSCFERQNYTLAEFFYKKALDGYNEIAFEAKLCLSQLYSIQKRFPEAESLIKQLLNTVDYCDDIHHQASIIYGRLENRQAQFNQTELYFKTARGNFRWQQCVSYFLMLWNQSEFEKAKAFVDWYKQVESIYGQEIPLSVKNAFKTFESEISIKDGNT